MKILVVSQYFYPENFRINNLCLELKRLGHEVHVLTGKPNYPLGEYFEGYTFKKNEDEVWEGVNIYRVPLRARKHGALNLIRNYISFVWHANKRVEKMYKEQFDIIYVFEVSPMTVALPAIKLKKMKRIPIIMNVQDLWPENIIAITGINNKIVNFFLNKLVNYIYRNCDLLLVASPAFIEKIKLQFFKKDVRLEYWPQYSLIDATLVKEKIFENKNFNIVFTGNIGQAQGLDIVIEAAKQLKNTNIVFHIIGAGREKEKLQEMAEINNVTEKVIFYGHIDEKEINRYLSSADVALLILQANPIFDMTIPAKLQTYLACGCPILGCVNGISKSIIEDAQVGLTCNCISSEELVRISLEFLQLNSLDLFKENAISYYLQNFNKEKLISKLSKYMEELTNEYIQR